MNQLRYKKEFLKKFVALPKGIQAAYAELEKEFIENPFHPHLHTKGLHGKLRNHYSFRITRDYRVVFEFAAEAEIHLITVGHRRDIYKKI